MKAVQVVEPRQIKLIEKIKPERHNENDVLIKVMQVGICGSDLHIYHGTNPLATLPRIIGHEVAGIVEEIGGEVKHLAVGDHVVIEPIQTCGECYACRLGRRNVCAELKVYGVHLDGGMREYMLMPSELVHKVNPALPWAETVLVEPLTIGAQANWRGQVQAGDFVFIMGAGPIGLCCLKIAKYLGATCLISDLNEERLQFAKSWGADYTIQANKVDVREEVLKLTNQLGANVIIDAVCTPHTVEEAVHVASVAGRVVVLGFDERPSSIAQLPITKHELSIVGSRLQANKFSEVIQLVNDRTIDLTGLVTHQYPLDQVVEAFQFVENNPEQVRKVVITFHDD